MKNEMEVGSESYKNELRYNGWRGLGRKSRVQACSVMHSQVTNAFPLIMLHISIYSDADKKKRIRNQIPVFGYLNCNSNIKAID
jgi:invasion protein IalB